MIKSLIPVPEYAMNTTGLTVEQAARIAAEWEVEYYRRIAECVIGEYGLDAFEIGRIVGKVKEEMSRASDRQ